jgi:hypothetical protein
MSRARRGGWVVLAATLAAASPAWPWGCQGHEIVAYVAYRHLSPAAKAGVQSLIGRPASVIHVKRNCAVTELLALANVSSWADDIRAEEPSTAPWHFLDIPRGTRSSTDPARFCPAAGCVTRAITTQLARLEDTSLSKQQRAEALMYVVHFVGDVHQPLHCTTNHDRGGNCVPVDFFGERAHPDPWSRHGDWTPNLHAVWDSRIIDRALGSHGVERYADALDHEFAGKLSAWQRGTPADWAMESHRVADDVVYAKLPVALPVEAGDVARCDQNHISDHWHGFDEQLAQPYYDAVRPALDEQLAKAGARLAMLLNRVWH